MCHGNVRRWFSKIGWNLLYFIILCILYRVDNIKKWKVKKISEELEYHIAILETIGYKCKSGVSYILFLMKPFHYVLGLQINNEPSVIYYYYATCALHVIVSLF